MKDKNEKTDDTEIGKLISEIVESGEPDLAEAIELTHESLGYAKRLTAIVFGQDAACNSSSSPALVLEVYDRINERLIEDEDEDD